MKKLEKHIISTSQFDFAHRDCHSERSRSLLMAMLIFLLIISFNSNAQKIDAFARVLVSPREGVVRQPYKVTIVVHSSTWFAKPLQFANLQIDDAFIIPFTRTVSSINYINNKKYATLSFYYLVFPYNTGAIEIPELVINTSIPPEGESQGQEFTIRSKPQNIKVNPLPSSKTDQVWMVASNITITESWNKPLTNLKVGDVLERKITINAAGTLPSLILPLEIEKPESTSIYKKEPVLQDKRNDKEINGDRIESYSYLFEEEAEIVLPEETVIWWNPSTKKINKRILPAQKLMIAFNPDLAMMESLKDSLLAMSAPVEVQEVTKSFPWLRISIIVLILLFVGYFGIKTIRWIYKKIKTKRSEYLQSETYHFKQVIHLLNHKSSTDFIRELYIWFDKTRKTGQNAAIYYFLNQEEKKLLESVIQNNKSVLNSEIKRELIRMLQKLRIQIIHPEFQNEKGSQLNPI